MTTEIKLSCKNGLFYVIYFNATKFNEGKIVSINGYKYILREEWRDLAKKRLV